MDDAPKAVVCAESNKSFHSKVTGARIFADDKRPAGRNAVEKAQKGHRENRAPQLVIP